MNNHKEEIQNKTETEQGRAERERERERERRKTNSTFPVNGAEGQILSLNISMRITRQNTGRNQTR